MLDVFGEDGSFDGAPNRAFVDLVVEEFHLLIGGGDLPAEFADFRHVAVFLALLGFLELDLKVIEFADVFRPFRNEFGGVEAGKGFHFLGNVAALGFGIDMLAGADRDIDDAFFHRGNDRELGTRANLAIGLDGEVERNDTDDGDGDEDQAPNDESHFAFGAGRVSQKGTRRVVSFHERHRFDFDGVGDAAGAEARDFIERRRIGLGFIARGVFDKHDAEHGAGGIFRLDGRDQKGVKIGRREIGRSGILKQRVAHELLGGLAVEDDRGLAVTHVIEEEPLDLKDVGAFVGFVHIGDGNHLFAHARIQFDGDPIRLHRVTRKVGNVDGHRAEEKMLVDALREPNQLVTGAAIFFDEVEMAIRERLLDGTDHANQKIEERPVHARIVHRRRRHRHRENHRDFSMQLHGNKKQFIRRGIDRRIDRIVIDEERRNDQGLRFARTAPNRDRDARDRRARAHQLQLHQIVFENQFRAVRHFGDPNPGAGGLDRLTRNTDHFGEQTVAFRFRLDHLGERGHRLLENCRQIRVRQRNC